MANNALTREKLAKFLPNHEAIKAWEDMQKTAAGLPEQIAALEQSIEVVEDAAADAQTAADAAQDTADDALAGVDALGLIPYITLSATATVPNERALAVNPLHLTLADGGPGAAVTLGSADLVAILPGDVAEAAGALADATGLALALAANATYLVDGLLTFQAAAVTTGMALAFTLPAGASISGGYSHNVSASGIEGSYNIASGAVKGNTSAVLVGAENVPASGRWVIKTAATAGNAQLQFRTEVAASAVTLKADLSVLVARRLV